MREEVLLCWTKTWQKQSKDIGHCQLVLLSKIAGKSVNIIQIYALVAIRT